MSKTPNFDAAVKKILDETESGEVRCALFGTTWHRTQEEIDRYRHYNVPPSPYHFDTEWKWLAYFDLGFQFWWNKHFDTGEPVLTVHHPASGIRVLPDVEWHNHDFSEAAIAYDPTRSFFPQLRELQLRVPMPATYNIVPPVNSISLLSQGDRESYFMFGCKSERSFFCIGSLDVADSSLVSLSTNVQKSHTIGHSRNIFNAQYVFESLDCMDSAFLFDCRNCKNCFGATNKRNKEYLWFNEQLTAEEWNRRRAEVDLGKRSVVEKWRTEFEQLLLTKAVWPENFNFKSSNSTGEYLTGAVRCTQCFFSDGAIVDTHQSAWMFGSTEQNLCMWGAVNTRESYMCVTSPDSSNLRYVYRSSGCDTCEYVMGCVNCRDCFGCVGLKNKRFCIFNNQYSEEEYWKRLDELKTSMVDRGEYGRFFPVEFSSTYVPEGGSFMYAGATEEQMRILGGNVFLPDTEGAVKEPATEPRGAAEVPDSIDAITEEWIGQPIYDEAAKRTFTIMPTDAAHYKALRIAPPTIHFIRRVNDTIRSGQIASLEDRACAICEKTVLTSKNLTYPERKIYCNEHYLEFIEKNG